MLSSEGNPSFPASELDTLCLTPNLSAHFSYFPISKLENWYVILKLLCLRMGFSFNPSSTNVGPDRMGC